MQATIMKINELSPPVQGDGTIHPTTETLYRPLIRLLQGDLMVAELVALVGNDKKRKRAAIEYLFNLVPIVSADPKQLQEEAESRFLDVLVELIEDKYFLMDVVRFSMERIASTHLQNPTRRVEHWLNIGSQYQRWHPENPRIEWLDALIAKSPRVGLNYIAGVKPEDHSDWVYGYFNQLQGKHSILALCDSQRALKLYKSLQWNECLDYVKGPERTKALEIDLGL
jgi:hypothetical protein